MVTRAYNLSTQEAETGESQAWGQSGLYRDPVSYSNIADKKEKVKQT